MSGTVLLLALFFTACTVTVEEDQPEPTSEHVPLAFRLETLREEYPADVPMAIKFSLVNQSDESLSVLKWHTPLEGIAGDIFRIVGEGGVVEYRGPMVRRGEPELQDYVKIEPGKAVTVEVDLLKGYDLSAPGIYQVNFQAKLLDVVPAGENAPRSVEQHRGLIAKGHGIFLHVIGQ